MDTNGEKATQEELLGAEGKRRVRYTFDKEKPFTREILGGAPLTSRAVTSSGSRLCVTLHALLSGRDPGDGRSRREA